MTFDTAQTDQFAERSGTDAQVLVLLEPRHRITGEIVPMGLWTGDDHQTLTLTGDGPVTLPLYELEIPDVD